MPSREITDAQERKVLGHRPRAAPERQKEASRPPGTAGFRALGNPKSSKTGCFRAPESPKTGPGRPFGPRSSLRGRQKGGFRCNLGLISPKLRPAVDCEPGPSPTNLRETRPCQTPAKVI